VDEAFAAVQCTAEEKKKRGEKSAQQGRKQQAQDLESDSEDSSSHLDSDSIVPVEILECIVVESS
jgi:hypothetical protein